MSKHTQGPWEPEHHKSEPPSAELLEIIRWNLSTAANLTRTQQLLLAFARLHDWGQSARANADGSVTCSAMVSLRDGGWTTESRRFVCMNELRAWAGY